MSNPPTNPSTLLRGQIYYVDWGDESVGSGGAMEKERPSLIVQNNMGNMFSPYTIIVPIHHDNAKMLPVHVRVPHGVGGLTKDSVVDCGSIYTIPTTALMKRTGHLPTQYMTQVDKALKVSLDL